MAEAKLQTQDGKDSGQVQVNDALIQGPVKKAVIYEVLRMQMANRRAGTHKVKSRGEVALTTKKLYRQKGTGNARHGDKGANIYVGGGRAFGPKPRDYSYTMPKKARKEALKSALRIKFKNNLVTLLDKLELSAIKTKEAAKLVKNLNLKKALILVTDNDEKIFKSFKNIPYMKVLLADAVNVYDLLRYDQLVLTQASLEKVEAKVFAEKGAA